MSDENGAKGQPSADQIMKALEKSGYLFENKIARKAEALGYHVESSWAFKDPDESTSREVDIRAVKEVHSDENYKIQIVTELLIECKNSDSPIVFLKTEKNERELKHSAPVEYVFPYKLYKRRLTQHSYREVGGFIRFKLARSHYYYSEAKKATQFAKIVRKSSDWHANHDGIYDSLILPQVKAVESRLKEVNRKYSAAGWSTVWLFFNVVVLRDHLFSVDLGDPELRPMAEGRVSFVRHIRSGTLDGYYLTDFVTEEYLDKYIEEIQQFAERVALISGREMRTDEYWDTP